MPKKAKKKQKKGKKVDRYLALEKLSKEIKTEIKRPKLKPRTLRKLFNELYLFATHDHLTGVFNRRILDELLGKEMERSIRHNLSLSVIMLDIDDFKEYNDTYGHLQGDIALKTVTNSIQELTRAEDFVARYGGEEFIIVLPDTNLKKAKEIAERIRKKIAGTRIKVATKNLEPGYENITVSMGVARLTKKGSYEMLHQADVALYKAKERGKNMVCVAN